MNWNFRLTIIAFFIISLVFGRRELFDKKCRRDCDTEQGTLACWKDTVDGFAFGLSTAMIDYCQVILNIRNLTTDKDTWYNESVSILMEQIEEYTFDEEVKELTKDDIMKLAISVLNQCFNASSSMQDVPEPTCFSCSKEDKNSIKRWFISSIVLNSLSLLFLCIILGLYGFYSRYTYQPYTPVK